MSTEREQERAKESVLKIAESRRMAVQERGGGIWFVWDGPKEYHAERVGTDWQDAENRLIAATPEAAGRGDGTLENQVRRLTEELDALKAERDHPETEDFFKGVPLEAAHQRARWPTENDAGKAPADWFWLVGYLAGKCLASHIAGNQEKALHHTISTAAALANWHLAIKGKTDMRPGIDTPPGEQRQPSPSELGTLEEPRLPNREEELAAEEYHAAPPSGEQAASPEVKNEATNVVHIGSLGEPETRPLNHTELEFICNGLQIASQGAAKSMARELLARREPPTLGRDMTEAEWSRAVLMPPSEVKNGASPAEQVDLSAATRAYNKVVRHAPQPGASPVTEPGGDVKEK